MDLLLSINYSLAGIKEAAGDFWAIASKYRHITFSGTLGAGKTTFIHALCNVLNVKDAVSSPTYALVNEYHFHDAHREQVIFHMDWYRLSGEDEAIQAGMEDCLNNAAAYSFVEWPEKAPGLLRSPYLSVEIDQLSEQDRVLNIYLR